MPADHEKSWGDPPCRKVPGDPGPRPLFSFRDLRSGTPKIKEAQKTPRLHNKLGFAAVPPKQAPKQPRLHNTFEAAPPKQPPKQG